MLQEIELEKAGKIVIPEEVGPSIGDLHEYLKKNYPNDHPSDPMLRGILKTLETAQQILREYGATR